MIIKELRTWPIVLAVAGTALLAMPAAAQQQPFGGTKAQGKATAPARAAAKDDGASHPAGDGQLRQRVEQLEEQLADMQVVIGTLESLGKAPSGGAPAPAFRGSPGGGGVDQARVDSLETQIRALSSQIEQLADQVRQLANRRGDAGPGFGTTTMPPSRDALPPARQELGSYPRTSPPVDQARAQPGGFGSVTVTPGEGDPIGRMITTDPPESGTSSAALPPAVTTAGNPKELYETGYGYLLQQDYGAAEAAFDEFLRRYPGDRLAADAQYWLGETLYVQRRFKPAGQAFLRVIEKHQASAKVPNSILKLAMTLEQLGQKDCALFTELDSRHPNAPADVKSRARTLKQRVGCP